MKRVALLVTLFACFPVYAQKPTSPLCTRDTAVDTTKQQILITRTFDSAIPRIAVLVRAADLLWPHDQEKALAAFTEGFDLAVPSLELAVIDLAEIQHLPLDHLAADAALVLNDVPVTMLFAVFETSVESQEHDANQPTPSGIIKKGGRSTLQTICDQAPLIRLAFLGRYPPKIAVRGCELVKLG